MIPPTVAGGPAAGLTLVATVLLLLLVVEREVFRAHGDGRSTARYLNTALVPLALLTAAGLVVRVWEFWW